MLCDDLEVVNIKDLPAGSTHLNIVPVKHTNVKAAAVKIRVTELIRD